MTAVYTVTPPKAPLVCQICGGEDDDETFTMHCCHAPVHKGCLKEYCVDAPTIPIITHFVNEHSLGDRLERHYTKCFNCVGYINLDWALNDGKTVAFGLDALLYFRNQAYEDWLRAMLYCFKYLEQFSDEQTQKWYVSTFKQFETYLDAVLDSICKYYLDRHTDLALLCY